MDENYVIPNQETKPEPANIEQPPAAGVTENSAYRSPDIDAMTDENVHFDREGYWQALSGNVPQGQGAHPRTLREMLGEASRQITEMDENGYWNENIRYRQEIDNIGKLEQNLDAWRDSITGSSSEDDTWQS